MLQTIERAVARTARISKGLPEFSKTIGISAVATYETALGPGQRLVRRYPVRKFVQHTGILSRRISPKTR